MLTVSKYFLPVAALLFLVGCSNSDSPEEILDSILDKASVSLSGLSQHDITYENANGGVIHKDRYCPNGMLGDKNGKDGTWIVAGNDLIVNNTSNGTAVTYTTINAKLEKNTSYPATGGATFKVTKIADTICL